MIRLFRVSIPTGSLALLISEIGLVTSAYILASYFVLPYDSTVFLLYDGGLYRILSVTGSIILGLHFQDLYTHIRIHSRIALLQQLSLIMGIAFLIQGLISYANQDLRMPMRLMVLGSAFAICAIFLWRILYAKYLVSVVGAQRLLFVGGNVLTDAIAEHLKIRPDLGVDVIGYVDDNDLPGTPRAGGKVLGPISALRRIATEVSPDRIVVGMSERRNYMPVLDLLELRFSGILVEEANTTYESVCMRISTLELRPSQLVFSGELGPRQGIVFLQSVFNFTAALVGSIVLLPVMLAIALGVKLSSPGPILYGQTRVGLGGNTFTVYKFRSMHQNAEAATGAVWASKDDPRITRFGRFLRKFRFDELPQLFNVLRGDMALVGPRPERPEFVAILSERIPFYRQRHCVKPGITGWAQVNHKYGDTIEDSVTKLEYDLYYIKNLSSTLDAYIIFQTLKIILLTRGAQ
jgi:sugar transferase (PEP-CTERM system associated)